MARGAAQGTLDRGRATRDRLVAAALELVGEVGWSRVTTRLVAERAGARPGLVHYHFASVEDLLVTAATGVVRQMLGDVLGELTAHRDLDTGLAWLLGELGRYTGTDPASLLLTEAFLAASRIPRLHTDLGAAISGFRAGVADWLRGLGHTADADAAATVLAATIDGLVLHRALDPDLDPAALAGPLHRLLASGGGRTTT
ncbi:MAG TPA: TetR/AcrR family transcriptional regulator [Streptosporangiaceae bacterium]|jgi:AcrR family transcriptional regulator